VLIAGGQNEAGPLLSAELYDPTSQTFTLLPATGDTELQSDATFGAAAPLPGGDVLIVSGTSEIFDPSSDTFTALPPGVSHQLQTARREETATALPDGDVLIAGGETDGIDAIQSAELFDPRSDTFGAGPPARLARSARRARPDPKARRARAGRSDSSRAPPRQSPRYDTASG
jgi:hypothetical protein